MFRRGLAVLLCSAMLAGSLPETSFAAENAETVETAETDTAQAEAEEAEPEKQENDASTESGETVQTSQTAVPETQTVSGTEGAERTDIGETEKTEITETEANTEASGETNGTETQTETATVTETETTTVAETQTETATAAETESVAETAAATETTTETEETAAIVETGEETTEVVTEEETAEEVITKEIENAGTSGNEYVAVSNVKTTYNSISFDYEIKDSSVRYLYISNAKDGRYIGYNTSDSITITGLNPSTEYNISFAGYSVKEKFYEFSEKTAECPYDVKYEVTSARADAITLSAEISAREGAEYKLPERFRLNWKCFDESGKHISDLDGISSVYVSEDSLPKKITSIIEDPRYMFENTKYTFEMWISEPTNYDFYSYSQYATERKEVTTPKSVISDVDIKFTPSDSDSSVANYTLTTGSYKDSVEGAVVFRLKGSSGGWNEEYSSFSTQDGAATGELYGLALGSTYEYMINAAGFKKTGEFTNGEAKLKWDALYDIGALDVVATFKLDEATKTEGASYDVYVGYKRHSELSTYWETNGLEKGEDGSYKAVVSYLRPNTEYDIQLVVYEYLSNGSENRYEAFETVTTKASTVKTNIIKTYLNAVRFSAVFDSSVRTKYTEGVEVYPYIKGQDGTYTLIEDADSIYLYSDNEYGDEFAISGLESNKVYEISFGYVDEDYEDEPYFEYGTMTFKTAADDRTITIDTPEAGVSNITINGTFKGSAVPYDDSSCIVLLCRESDSDKWKTMDSTDIYVDEDDQSSDIERTFRLYADNLEGGKTYEYAVGIGTWNKQDIESLKDVKKGTVKLNPDNRKIEVETTSLLNGVVVRAKLLGQYIDNDNYAYIFYREKGKTDASWSYQRLSFYDDSRETSSVITNYNGEELKSGTTYEYKHSMSIPAKEEDYAGLDGGEFTYSQPEDDRTLEIKTTESRTTARFAVTLSGNRAVTNYVALFCREKGSQSWKRTSGSVSWDNHSAIELNVSGLSSKTEYEYTIGISNRYISSVDDIAAGKQNGTFTTKDDERKLGIPVITTGYSYADIAVAVDGLTDNDGSSYVSLYMKNTTQQNANWYRQDYKYVYSSNSVAKFSLNGLTLGTTYDYAFVISDSSRGVTPDSEEFKELSENKKLVDKFETKKSDYTLAITYGENSIFGKEILQLKAGSATYNEKNFDVTLTVRESETKDYITGRTVSLNSVDYSAETVFTNLSEKTKYDVTATLYAKIVRDNSLTREPVATKEYSFTTKAAAAPAELKADVTDLYLNSWNTDYQSYYFDAVNISVPDGASNEVTWTSSNPDVAYVLNSGIVIAGKPGEATITAASVLAPGVTTTVNVHVKDYAVIFVDKTANTATPTLYNSVYTFKNKESDNVAYATTTDNGKTFLTVKATGISDDPNIAYWDEEKQCIISKNVGFTTIVLDAEGFKTDLYVTVYADSPDFELRLSPTEEDIMDASYPALKKDGTYQIASGLDYYYQLSAIANPETLNYNINEVLSYTSSDPTVLTVSGNGSVKGLKKGTATVTVAYDTNKIKALLDEDPYNTEIAELAKHTDLADKTKTVTFDVRPLYSENLPEVHAITNVHKLLKDVTIGEGWSWRDPETPLYSLPNGGNAYYEFEAEYTGADFYNYEGTAKVYISTITGVDVVNNGSNVISANGTDSMNLIVKPVVYGYTGLIEGKDYEVFFTDTNVTVAPDTAGYKITAAKKGKYTLKPEIKVNGTVVAAGSYAITAVDGKLIDHIDIEPETDNQNVTIKGSTIYFNSNADVENFNLKATAIDREGNVSTDTKLTWAITDKSVADVDAKASDRDVTVKVKGEGHAVIQVTAGDEAKASAQYRLEVRNYKPRVEGDKITVNTAYDYDTIYGEALSANQYGAISIASAYGDRIAGVQVVDAGAEDGINNLSGKASKDFRADYYSGFDSDSKNHEEQYVIEPIDPSMAAGKHNVKLAVTTDSGFTYTYPLTVTVINKQPKVTAKVSNTMNLFYLGDKGYFDITLEKNKSKDTDYGIESLKWSKDVSEGFQFNYTGTSLAKTPNVKRCFIDGSQVKVSNGKLTASDIASGTVTIKLYGVREKYELPVTVKYSYKKPKLTTADWKTGKNVSTIIPSIAGGKSGSVYVVADKKQLYYTSGYGTENSRYKYYNEIRCENEKVSINKSGNSISFSYSGTETQFDIPLTIDSYNWREALTVTHKVKTTNPTAVLGNAKLTYNTNYNSEAYVKVSLKDYPQDEYRIETSGGQYLYSVISAVDVAGADAASQELLTNDKLKIEYRNRGRVSVRLNASKLGTTIPKGAAYVLTPYCYDVSTGENKALNALTLKITFTNKQVTVKASAKGKLDLAIADTRYDYDDYDDYDSDYDWLTANSMAVTAKFSNLGSGYDVVSAKLTGEYSKYFTLKYYDGDYRSNPTYYLKISNKGRGRLKAGQNYNLSIIYTLEDSDGNRINVKSNILKVKPIQKAPKLTVAGDNKILYAAASDLYRICVIRTPYYNTGLDKDYYRIKSAYGSLDTNKDGKADIKVSLYDNYSSEGYAELKIQLADKDAVVASAKGKSYTIPVTVELVGRDGISKDATIKVKVTVKR